jgi:ATP/maltotriose-dependent transcriptional regulator MalT
MGVVESLARAREAYEQREWAAAYEALTDHDSALDPDDLALLATAAFLLGRHQDCLSALQRAHKASADAGDVLGAVRCGLWVAMMAFASGDMAVRNGWLARCDRLLEDIEDDSVERGYRLIHQMFDHIFSGEMELAYDVSRQITDYGRRYGDPDLLVNGLNAEGRALLHLGRVPEGIARLDEAMVGVAAGEVHPFFAGEIYCSVIEACQEISDFGRAAEWTRALTDWIETQPELVPFTGQCAVHRGQILRLNGAFPAAIDEFERAIDRYAALGSAPAAGLAHGEAGEVHRLRGDYTAADAAYERALEYGYEPQPGQALLWLAQGRAPAALGAVRRLLAEQHDPVYRSRLLPGAVEVLLGCGQTDDAATVAAELADVATSFGCRALQAMSQYAVGCCLLAEGRAGDAITELRAAQGRWQQLGAPYEVARCRLQLGRALRELADADSALAHLKAAHRTFEDLGAAPAAREVAALITPATPGSLTEREIEVLRLVATGRTNPQIAATLVLSEKTVARHLSNIFTKLGVTSRTAAAAFAFENRLV